ncbi:type I polyketide synthase [Dinghuibacter silviterrae]|uniref:Acyl transferase domain-containing protein n=1 Tax=Dinghuibacter silviterrae TaxID=1539049 RepID=A0A4R8DN86_9BACT|nr:type I polyketide synthase [Dinghuibacter silviterrae]TDW99258.1 acyl transferase domain-containing protein [Dinghuibacter silviterrae]
MRKTNLIGITPFEKPDVGLAIALSKTGAFPVLHLGRNRDKAVEALDAMVGGTREPFGVCMVSDTLSGISLPSQVELVIAPFRVKAMWFCQVHTVAEAQKAKAEGASAIIVKGNEGAGRVGEESTFILFQRIIREVRGIDIWVQGGAGIHTSAALVAMGASGVVLDSQLVLFPECGASKEFKDVCSKLTGSETRVIDGVRVLDRPNLEEVPIGQDIAIAGSLVARYGKLDRMVTGLHEAMRGHLRQAKAGKVLGPGNTLSTALGTTYPIAQGPMTRVSDVPAFAGAVAEAGGLPFVALSLLKGDQAKQLIRQTRQTAGENAWGVGILGFAPQTLRDEQLEYIREEKPPFVLIAGGRPSQAKSLEDIGINTFLHTPSPILLDLFLKEGARKFVFEGRECGGHVGPLSSLVLWEKQIERLLQEDHADALQVFFAGGIHDAFSAAFVAVMAAPLAMRGAGVGVLMGTAYLYTKEAVDTGAVLPQFQEEAIRQTDTILLETAPGHETRCLDSPFAVFFREEKERLREIGMDRKAMWDHLEQLNVGRLRIATKGMERKGEKVLPVSAEEQAEKGMYMIGQVVALRDKVVTVEALHKDVSEGSVTLLDAVPAMAARRLEGRDVAIVGMACIFPGAGNLDAYWSNILGGRDCITEVPEDRWNKSLYYDPASTSGDRSHSKWGGFIPDTDFDPVVFGIPPQALAAIDPTQLLSLLVAKRALDDAGYGGKDVDGGNVSVIIGAEGGHDLANLYSFRAMYRQLLGELPPELDAALPTLTEDSFPGILANVISGRITNRLNLGGRNYTVDAACASSLAAVDLACQELATGRSDMVLAGAADLHNGITDYLLFSSTHALSRKGRCSTFDAGADGIALGEGVAMLVLKRYTDAVHDGDRIYAVIKGVGGSSDGKSLGLTAPRRSGQVKALERAYEQAGVSPSLVGMVEAHGTGTVVGDKTELSALSDLFSREGALPGQANLGSVKTQIGHTKCAAGLAGLIKAALSVYHGVKPPTLHLSTPNAYYTPAFSPFQFSLQAGIWTEDRRLAGVSAFGFGGTNFHAVIENHLENTPPTAAWPAELLVFRGDNPEEALALLDTVRAMVRDTDEISLKDLAYSLALSSEKPVQLCMVAEGREDLLNKDVLYTKKVEGKIAFLFPGQGSQRVNMARELMVHIPSLRRWVKGRPEYEQVLFPPAVFDEDARRRQNERVKDTRLAQPLLGMVDMAIASLLRDLGIEPDMLAGHSYGELPALCFAGVFEEDQLVSLSEKRAAAVLEAVGDDKGVMVAVSCPQGSLGDIVGEGVYAVNHNAPQQWVLAGDTPSMERLKQKLSDLKIDYRPLEVACAFHSPLLAGSRELYRSALKGVPFRRPTLPVWSNTTAGVYPVSPEAIKNRLADHLVQPVRFCEEVQKMYEDGARIFLEVGPGKVLTGLTRTILGKEVLLLHTEEKGQSGLSRFLSALAGVVASGREIRWEKLFEGRGARQVDLDPSAFRRSASTWVVNGQWARPLSGDLPVRAPVVTPLEIMGNKTSSYMSNGGAEHIVQEYLLSVRQLIQAQRDVMLGYLGQAVPGASLGDAVLVRPAAVTGPGVAGPGLEAPAAALRPAAAPVPATAAAAPAARTEPELRKLLLQVVSEKTGYPSDMLGMDMDLEGDLSIDSIKRMEITGALRIQLGGLTAPGKSEDAVVEQLAALKTLNGLLQWIVQHTGEAVPPAPKLSRLRFELTPTLFSATSRQDLKGQRFAITDDGGAIAPAIKERLEKYGATATVVSSGDALETYDGLILLDVFAAVKKLTIDESFGMVKKLDLNRVKWIYAISDLGGYMTLPGEARFLRHFQGFPGFLKSLDKEWEKTKCRMINLQNKLSPDAIAGIALDEILNPDHPSEVFYDHTVRHTHELVPSRLAEGNVSDINLDKEAVVLVLGGAQGITAELMTRFSKDYPCRYVLVGRSLDPRLEGRDQYRFLKTREEIRQYLLARGTGGTPAEIEKRTEEIFKWNQILNTLSAMEANGATVIYHSLDLRDEEGLRQFMAGVYATHGRVDGVVHGAGLLEDKLFHQKTLESFERVFSTKVTPLRVLAEELRSDVQFVILFSSVASVYGNRGQTDYAAANSVIDRYARELKKLIQGKVLAINWGPWKGAGMVTPGLEREYERKGIGLIPLETGKESFLNELKYGRESQVLIMAE